MFYCNKCGEKRGWPTDTLFKSGGACEICGKRAVCNDVPSKYLPIPGGGIQDTQLGGDDNDK